MPTLAYTTNSRRATQEELGRTASADLAAWFFFQLAADHVLLPILVGTFALSRTVTRHSTVINLCCTWILSGIISSLLLYTSQATGPEPSKGLCSAQAALFSGTFPMTSIATLALVYRTWLSCTPSRSQLREKRITRLANVMLLAAPYCALALFTAIGAKLAVQYPDRVDREWRFFYCSVNLKPFTVVGTVFSAIVCIAATGLFAHLALKQLQKHETRTPRQHAAKGQIGFRIRVGLLTLCILTAALANLGSIADTGTAFPDMFTASVGMAVFLIFASQPDVLRAWWSYRPFQSPQRPRAQRPVPLRTPYPSFDLDLLNKRTDSDLSEKARLEALHAYYLERVRNEGARVDIIDRPQDAFIVGSEPRRACALSRLSRTTTVP